MAGILGCARKTDTPKTAPAMQKAPKAASGDPYPDRARYAGLRETCARAGEAVPPAAARGLWQDLQTIRKGALMGPALTEFSDRADIFFCAYDLSPPFVGQWRPTYGIVLVSNDPKISSDRKLTNLAHELIHGIQDSNHVIDYDPSWTIDDYQLNLLSSEASGRVGQMLIALELRDQGIKGPWQDCLANFRDIAEPVGKAYAAAQKKHLPHAEALAQAGALGWDLQMRDPGWISLYNNRLLQGFLGELLDGELKAPSGSHYDLDTARKTGYISETLNFTAGITAFPAYDERFGGDPNMQAAFDYLGLERLGRTLGRDAPAYKDELRRQQQAHNPFLGVDLARARRILDDPKNLMSPLGAMISLAGFGNPPPADKPASPSLR